MKGKTALKYFIALLPFLSVAAANGQIETPVVRARVVPDTIMIGDRFRLEVEVEKDMVQIVEFPVYEPQQEGGEIEVMGETPVDTLTLEGRRMLLKKSYEMAVFDEGIYSMGRIPVLYADKNIVDTIYSADSLRLFVDTYIIDTTTQKIYDIKPTIHTPVKFGEFGGYLFNGLIILQLLVAVIYLLARRLARRKSGYKTPSKPDEPPHLTAIRELEKLSEEKLWQNNRHKLYYTRLTDIIRQYIEHRYDIGGMEMTSDEIMDALKKISLGERSMTQIGRLLSTSDYVKFAKYIPDTEDNEMSFNDAYYFVEDTKIIAPVPEEKEEEVRDEK